jgi:hypothetical protein
MTTICYPYLRYSNTSQGKGDSTRRQTTWHEEIAKEEGWTLDNTFRMQDKGKSAFHGHHLKADLGEFLRAINDGRVRPGSVLAFEEMDRLSRQPLKDAFPLFVGILSAGVKIRTRERLYAEADLNDLGTLVGILVKQKGANDESQKKSDRVKAQWASWRAGVAEGKKNPPPGRLPGWLRLNGPDRKSSTGVELVEPAAAAVRLIFKMAGEGMGTDRIVRRLNEARVPAFGKGGTWRETYVAKILAQRTATGALTVRDPVTGDVSSFPGFYPAAITEDEWYKARGVLAARAVPGKGQKSEGRMIGRGAGVANLFTGLARDAYTGEVMHLLTYDSDRGEGGDALVSAAALRGETSGGRRGVPYRVFEAAFVRFVCELRPDDLLGGDQSADAGRLLVLDGRMAELEHNIALAKDRARAGGAVASILDLLAGWDDDLKKVLKEREGVAARLASLDGDALGATQSAARRLREAQGAVRAAEGPDRKKEAEEALRELRGVLKAAVRRLVAGVWVAAWHVDASRRAAEVQVRLAGGSVRAFLIAWRRGGQYPGLGIAGGGLVGREGADDHLDGKLLSEFRTDDRVRDWFGRRNAALGSALREALDEEEETRRRLLAADRRDGGDRLDVYLAAESLDGRRPPFRPGKPRISPAEAARRAAAAGLPAAEVMARARKAAAREAVKAGLGARAALLKVRAALASLGAA